MTKKKILIIGKNGQLAGAIQAEVGSFGFEVIAFDRQEMDVTNWPQVKKILDKIKPDILINTSALQVVLQCEENPQRAMEVNFLAIQNLARECKERNIIFVTYSSDYVFDGEKGSAYEEDDLPNPLQIYGLSKLAGEYAALCIYPEKSFVVRTAGLYGGVKGSPEKGNFVLNIMKEATEKAKAGVGMEVSSEQIVSPTYAGDLAKATLELLSMKVDPGIYHLVNEGGCSWYEFTKEIFKLAKINVPLSPIDRGGLSAKGGNTAGKVRRPKFSIPKNTRARALGIVLPSWQEGLASYFRFLNSI
ncbi:MAG: dTDP-4-dehydrorhamnose reductase [Candidatus Zambryskibacteria bacterium RIFCSPLOWO2_01_FULL_39_39]|uniref:dTDP-4-dehydrorhamnose reductase n=1 Tax=Candidatus Zambryskibacteria bacterium RIFCSPLOWO2_01_FULL_39_39 TaxID=1802758 RepID=A0A1G2TYQ9_9BACT|nr:MAG: dTDP-4-dehydrorhamnose reductase [Parcubacteria group bacterium GW2011_GWA1_38_7]OHA87548.1 MAG: dTDP-4-dehydrorhamnose reductase [Candidatus Zambryskibacteria bacterium RIFCSPHIGHO2_01_FULL_39_63]OHA95076.1 MAG: dTDP-4-dehydrorhamnose reductase [Candidatus Zambryskibacteria bacterium RIFCSPHIGHO2_02_FULL_39_19]OHA98196.1 MAG: dTDP-4-dehydrorhamnose reductase [Candidatus Zambryskibacteria bacterium RIFCSPHIGHO2_12_FULL_39_21]OHB02438.1 MAG: dTDP-4-dehydrorhamnose reductase [Candidatus Z